MSEITAEDECEEPEAEEDEDIGGGLDEAESSGDRTPAALERQRHDQSEGSGGQPFFSKDGPQEEEEKRKRERNEHAHRRPGDEVAGDGAGTAQRLIPRKGRNRRRRLQGPARELPEFERDAFENAQQRAGEQNASHQRIGEAAREQARPGD